MQDLLYFLAGAVSVIVVVVWIIWGNTYAYPIARQYPSEFRSGDLVHIIPLRVNGTVCGARYDSKGYARYTLEVPWPGIKKMVKVEMESSELITYVPANWE